MSRTMSQMHSAAIAKQAKVESRSTICPSAFVMLKFVKVGKFLSAFAPFVMRPRLFHWNTARIISAKPRVAMAR